MLHTCQLERFVSQPISLYYSHYIIFDEDNLDFYLYFLNSLAYNILVTI